MSNTFSRVAQWVGVSIVLLVWWNASFARLTNITLEELVTRSTLVAYGRTETKSADDSSTVTFEIATLLMGPSDVARKTVRICNDVTDVESYDLSRITRSYIVFAAAKDNCYAPVHGLRSVVQVREDAALTANISGEPSEQPLNTLLSKIKVLAEVRSSK
jgi:hypothetical protein